MVAVFGCCFGTSRGVYHSLRCFVSTRQVRVVIPVSAVGLRAAWTKTQDKYRTWKSELQFLKISPRRWWWMSRAVCKLKTTEDGEKPQVTWSAQTTTKADELSRQSRSRKSHCVCPDAIAHVFLGDLLLFRSRASRSVANGQDCATESVNWSKRPPFILLFFFPPLPIIVSVVCPTGPHPLRLARRPNRCDHGVIPKKHLFHRKLPRR